MVELAFALEICTTVMRIVNKILRSFFNLH